MKKYTLYTMVGFMWVNLSVNGTMNNFVTDFRVIATRQDSWRGSNLSAPGLKQEGQKYICHTREQAVVNGGVIPAKAGIQDGKFMSSTNVAMLSSPNALIGDLFLRHSEEKRSFDEESKNEILRLRLRMTINPEIQLEQQIESVRLFEHYI